MKPFYMLILFIWTLAGVLAAEQMSCAQALQRLIEGNDRYIRDQLEHPNRNADRREAVAAKQSPFAVIVGCSDSRVSPEIIFDQGIGDLFVVRVAGNVIGDLELDSVDYATLYLGAVCVIVLGHEDCGAVKAVIDGNTKDIQAVAKLIEPAINAVKQGSSKAVLSEAIKKNALLMKDYLLSSRVIKNLVKQKKVNVHAAYYDVDTGAVEWLK